ncbi:MAG: hypothetical protein HDT07_00705 [Bacteroidales bacterium]|nr:hypothetical protein [Bacteroidales bacterium]
MKKSFIYLALLAVGFGSALVACDDNFERPPMIVPVATMEANTTIAELKAEFYQTDNNYAVEVGTKPNGDHYIIKGRVTTSDEAGNFFKQLVIQDESSAIQISVDAYDLYLSYQNGQEIVIDVTGLYIGAYGRLMQLGAAPTSGYPSRIAEDTFTSDKVAQINGLSDPDAIAPAVVTIAELQTIKADKAKWLDWQCRLVTIEDVTFDNAGKQTLSTSGSNGVSQNFGNSEGKLILYTSGYSDFYDYYCPTGTGTVTGILSCYNDNWQIRLNSIDGLTGFETLDKAPSSGGGDTPGQTTGNGAEATPFTVADVIGGATGTDVWVKGYIVGWVEGQTLATGAHFDANNVSVASNILVAASPDVKTVDACIPVQLVSGTDARTALNLQANPGNLGKEVMLKGNLEKYFGTAGVKSTSDFKIDGAGSTPAGPVDPVSSIDQNFDASTAIPAGWSQIQVAGNKAWYVATFQENNYAAMTGYKGTAPFDQYLLTPPIDMSKVTDKTLTFDTQVNGYGSTTSKIEVLVLTDADLAKATATVLDAKFATAPASGYSDWVNSGKIDLSKFTGTVYVAFRYSATTDANYATWCVDNVKLNAK